MNINTEALLADIYTITSYGVTFKNNRDGTATFRNGDKFFAIGEEYEDDGETFWGWTWSTGVYEIDGDREIEEYFSTDGGQDADEALSAAVRHLGAVEAPIDNAAPTVHVCRSEDGERWIVQIDTGEGTGHVSVDLNDGRIFDGDPEVG